MPVITHRRVNEMRNSRRRLSVGAVGGYPGAAAGGTSPRSSTFGGTASMRGADCKPGATSLLTRRLSTRPQHVSLDVSAVAEATGREGLPATHKFSAGSAEGSSGLLSPAASPDIRPGVRAQSQPLASPPPPPSLSLSRASADGSHARATLAHVSARHEQRQSECLPIGVTSAADGKSLYPQCEQQGLLFPTPSSLAPTSSATGALLTASSVDAALSLFSQSIDMAVDDAGSQSVAHNGAVQQHGGMQSPAADSTGNVAACGSMHQQQSRNRQQQQQIQQARVEYMTDDDTGYCSDEDVRNDPLPTREHLIFSQSWSTWPTPCHHLYSGSNFSGSQSNGTRSYVVTVALKYVDMGVPELCGHFTICGLTAELPTLTTYFDAQIVGSGSSSFVTNQWDASVDTDRTHWNFFPAFAQYRNRFDSKDFNYKLSLSDKYIFMRWKERFVVPNYKLNRINGASYDGFYYVCYDRDEATITGYYYHKESDHYQCLKLSHVKQSTFAHFELA